MQSLFRERFLTFQDVLSRRSDRKPVAAIDFGKLNEPSRAWRPLYLAQIAGQTTRIAVTLDGHAMTIFPARLRDGAHFQERPLATISPPLEVF